MTQKHAYILANVRLVMIKYLFGQRLYSKYSFVYLFWLQNSMGFGASTDAIRIGIINSKVGELAPYGYSANQGIELAVDELTNRGIAIETVIEDDQSKPEKAALAMNRLITSEKVSLVVGALTSANTLAAASVAEKQKVSIVSPGATANSFSSDNYKFVFPVCFHNRLQGKMLSDFAEKKLKAKKVVLFSNKGTDYGSEVRESFLEFFTKDNNHAVKEFFYQESTSNFTPFFNTIRRSQKKKESDYDLIVFIGYAHQAGIAVRQARQTGVDLKFLGSDGWHENVFFDLAKEHAAGHYVITHFSHTDPSKNTKEFVEKFHKKFKTQPGIWVSLFYDSLMLAADVFSKFRNESTTRSSLQDTFARVKGYPGLTGSISFDKDIRSSKEGVVVMSEFDNETRSYKFKYSGRIKSLL